MQNNCLYFDVLLVALVGTIFMKPLNRSEESVGEVDDAANRPHDQPYGALAKPLHESRGATLLSTMQRPHHHARHSVH